MADGWQLNDYLPISGAAMDRRQLISSYFVLGFSYSEIVGFLTEYHGISIGLRQLHRILRSLGLRRHAKATNWDAVVSAIEHHLSGPGRTLGYRSMQARIRLSHGISIDRESVRLILSFLDQDGVRARCQRRLRRRRYWSKGPNYTYHIDGWDKLKTYGLCIHGCIDGFSRRIMWLEAGPSNNDPYVVCKYFADCVKELNGVPCIVRSDHGTENVNIELMQRILRNINGDRQARLGASFLYGRSTSNQRIEGWWSKLPAMGLKTWKEHFTRMDMLGIIDTSNDIHIECIRYCYLNLLRRELRLIRVQWNTHHIRANRASYSPAGKPDIMFHFPEIYGVQSYLNRICPEDVGILVELACEPVADCSPLCHEVFDSIVENQNIAAPSSLVEAAFMLRRYWMK